MSFRKQNIVPKTNKRNYKIDITGDYYLTYFELFYIISSAVLAVGLVVFAPIPAINWTVFVLVGLSYTLFIPASTSKVHNLLFKIFILKTTKTTIELVKPKLEDTEQLIVKSGQTKEYFDVLELETVSLDVEEDEGIHSAFEEFEKIIISADNLRWYIVKHVESEDLDHNIEYLNQFDGVSKNKTNFWMLAKFKEMVEESENIQQGKHYLIVKSSSKLTLKKIRNSLESQVWNFIKTKTLSVEKKKEILLYQSDLYDDQNEIKFGVLRNKINGMYCQYLVFGDSKPVISDFWLMPFAFEPWVKHTTTASKITSEYVVKNINRQLARAKAALNATSDPLKVKELEDTIESLDLTINNLRSGDQAIYKSLTLVEIWGATLDEVKQRTKKYRNILKDAGIGFAVPVADGRDVWKIKSPLSSNPPKYNDSLKDMLSYTLAASWGFASMMFKDEKGMILGRNASGVALWDPKMTNEDLQNDPLSRKNLNIAILGGSGSGKSTLTQKIVNWDIVTGGSVWVIDPKDEDYFGLCKEYGGEKFEFGLNNGTNKLNPFEIMGWESMDEKQRKHEIVSHGEFLDGWLNILFEDKDFKNKIIDVVKEKYVGKHKTNKMKWLTFTTITEEFKKRGKEYSSCLEKFSVFNTPEHFFNGQSNINDIYEKDFVVFQTSQIFNSSSNNIKDASLVLLTSLIQAKARQNKNTGKIFHAVIDEAHNFFNTSIGKLKIESLIREARGWNSGVILISQNPQDFMGGKIMNNITTTFYGSLDAETVTQLSKKLTISQAKEGLNDIEKRFILEASRGQFLVVVNSQKKVTLKVEMDEFEFDVIAGKSEQKINYWIEKTYNMTPEQYEENTRLARMSNEELYKIALSVYDEDMLKDIGRDGLIEVVSEIQNNAED